MFQGPQAYISPSVYPTKQESGKVVPTWNYVIVQVWGTPIIIEDEHWILAQIGELTNLYESEKADPWAITDAPEPFIKAQLKGIVSLELPIARIEGKWKVSQNQPRRNRKGVIAALQSEGFDDLAVEVAKRAEARQAADPPKVAYIFHSQRFRHRAPFSRKMMAVLQSGRFNLMSR